MVLCWFYKPFWASALILLGIVRFRNGSVSFLSFCNGSMRLCEVQYWFCEAFWGSIMVLQGLLRFVMDSHRSIGKVHMNPMRIYVNLWNLIWYTILNIPFNNLIFTDFWVAWNLPNRDISDTSNISSVHSFRYIGGSRGCARCTPPKGPDSFILTYKIFEM